MVSPPLGLFRLDPVQVIERIHGQYTAERAARVGTLERLSGRAAATRNSIQNLQSPLTALRAAADNLRSINGGGASFRATSSNDSIVTASARTGATSGSTEISVSTLARRSTFSFAAATGTYPSTATPLALKLDDSSEEKYRTVTFTLGTGDAPETVAIVLKSSTTIEDFVTSFNALSTRATATTVDTGTEDSPNLSIVITSNETGTTAANLTVEIGAALTDPDSDGDESDSVFANSVFTQATNATFTLTGIAGTFTRSENSVGDVVPGVTFELRSTGTATVTVSPDTDGVTLRVKQFVSAFNDLVGAVRTGNEPPNRGGIGSAPLRGTQIDDDLLAAIRTDFAGNAATSGGTSLAEIGFRTNRDGTVTLDETTLRERIGSSPSAVGAALDAFGERLGATGGTLTRFAGTNGLLTRAANEQNSRVTSYADRIERLDRLITSRYAALESSALRLQAALPRLESQSAVLQNLLDTPRYTRDPSPR